MSGEWPFLSMIGLGTKNSSHTSTHTYAHTHGTGGGLGTVHRRHYVLHAPQTRHHQPSFVTHAKHAIKQTLPVTIIFSALTYIMPVRQGYAMLEPSRRWLVLYKMCPRHAAACKRALLLPHAIAVVTARSGKYRELSPIYFPTRSREGSYRNGIGTGLGRDILPRYSQNRKGARSTTTG